MLRLPDTVATRSGSAAATRLQGAIASAPEGSLLVVIGAHRFGDDVNDPLRKLVRGSAWGGVLLVEASPPIAEELRQAVSVRNPLPRVPSSKIVVSNVGIRDNKGAQNATRPFFTFTGEGDGLPTWSTQIGSFNPVRFFRQMSGFARVGNWTREKIAAKVVRSKVACRSIVDEISRHATLAQSRPAVMMIDVEGLDCRVVAAQDWCAEPLNRLHLLVFEYKHCTEHAFRAAQQSLARCPWYGPTYTFANG